MRNFKKLDGGIGEEVVDKDDEQLPNFNAHIKSKERENYVDSAAHQIAEEIREAHSVYQSKEKCQTVFDINFVYLRFIYR